MQKGATRTRIHPGSCNVVRIGIPVLSPVRSAQPPPHHPCHPPDNVNTTHACEQFYDNSIQHQRAHASARARARVCMLSESFVIKRLHSEQKITRLTVNHKVTKQVGDVRRRSGCSSRRARARFSGSDGRVAKREVGSGRRLAAVMPNSNIRNSYKLNCEELHKLQS